jgi:hypothetical protein
MRIVARLAFGIGGVAAVVVVIRGVQGRWPEAIGAVIVMVVCTVVVAIWRD